MNFQLKERQTTIKTEIIAGITTFLTMVYIAFVNPSILGDAGVPFEQVFLATIIATVVGTLWMALFANYPIAVAPGMGLNAYFAYSVVANNPEINYSIAFAAVFVSGLLFIILSVTPLRKILIEAIPENLKYGITAGIGLFIAFIGFRLTGIVTADPVNLVKLGDLTSPSAALALTGLAITIILMALNVKGAIFYGIVVTGAVAFFTGQLQFDNGIMSIPSFEHGLAVVNPFTAIGDVIQYSLYTVVFSFLIVTLFDTTGTMIGVAQQAGLMKNNKFPRVRQALLSDSVGTTVGALFGTSPTSAYIESSSGVAAGGRTGLTTLTVSILFLLVLFFSPLVEAVANLSAITAPALIIVGSLMISNIAKIDWDQIDEAFPAFLIILIMPFTSSIATGIAFGFIAYPVMKIVMGKAKQVHWLLYIFALLFLYQLIFLPH
ncbi:NCS2 family permease [Tenuibacillus multivorans]|uniref:Putative MFS transporter, AGZA family, xanthine/uracil permease n=1 Tax=Tenuibacillus multivorans TaxID=237069 RepID=A0A1G9WZI9_9BACI|nr:NCS2 family permease [Tenuibacillus multivorans]GEL77301.1 guanine/hypoxanthine permease PbuO [Tenuibacillus multivorans]SDM89525.1 putative MFS transporter, AGZA family, xanthine/uracil permease [Tenuibacillus multivorans]